MLCPQCQHDNAQNSYFCTQCGESLRERILEEKPRKKISLFLIGGLVCGFFLGYLFHRVVPWSTEGEQRVRIEQGLEARTALKSLDDAGRNGAGEQKEPSTGMKAVTSEQDEKSPQKKPVVGEVVVGNPWGKIIAQIPCVLLRGAWVALPSRGHLGGDRLTLRLGDEGEFRMEKGIWRYGDPISLWSIEGGANLESLPLHPWKEGLPVQWLSILSKEPPMPVDIVAVGEIGRFVQCVMPSSIKEPGVFVQSNGVVGWSFGEWLKGGYLWAGLKGEELEYQISIENNYLITFSDGREEQFSKALAMGADLPALDRLEAFAEGFRLSPKLSWQETPTYLRADQVLKHMRTLTAQLLKEGLDSEVTDILDEKVLLETADSPLLLSAMAATAETYSMERAVDLAEGVGDYIRQIQGDKISDLDRLHSRLYKKWLEEVLDKGDFGNAWLVFTRAKDRFPDDPEIHLLGVETALAGGNWEEARRLLDAADYPGSLADRARVLSVRIDKQQEEENQIVIRFSPGSTQIPVGAVINGALDQAFVIDTGASMVTIPYATAETLGIEIDADNPRRVISTVGGRRSAHEVRIASIELGDWVVYDVQALVVDIPDKPGLGLLGLNYLNRFRVEINQEGGILSLKPR